MLMVDKELLSRKLSRLQNYVDVLKTADDINWQKYRDDLRIKAFVERYLHLAIEELLDIANHFVSFYQWREPAGYRDLLLILTEHGIFPQEHLTISLMPPSLTGNAGKIWSCSYRSCRELRTG